MAATVKIVTDALQDPEVQKLAKWLAIDIVKRAWKRITGRKPTSRDEKEIRQIVLASMDDVRRYDPKVAAIEDGSRRNPYREIQHKRSGRFRAKVAESAIRSKKSKRKPRVRRRK